MKREKPKGDGPGAILVKAFFPFRPDRRSWPPAIIAVEGSQQREASSLRQRSVFRKVRAVADRRFRLWPVRVGICAVKRQDALVDNPLASSDESRAMKGFFKQSDKE